MAILVRGSVEEVKAYRGRKVCTKIGTKKHQVYFRVEVDDFSFEEAVTTLRGSSNVVMFDYSGSEPFIKGYVPNVPIEGICVGVKVPVGADMTVDEVKRLLAEYPSWVTLILQLPEGYKNMELLYNINAKFKNVRFCGGYLFRLDGCKVGCCGADVFASKGITINDNNLIKDGCGCCMPTMAYEDVELEITTKDERQKSSNGSTLPKKPQKNTLFSSMLTKGSVAF